jgi:alpha-glucosidase
MREASVSGIPAMRPLFLEFPDDPACYKDERMTFLFGPSVLVANVLEPGAKERTLYLPKGCKWYDMNDNFRAYEGGQIITVPVDLGSIPMFLRGNAVYFTSEDIHHILSDTLKTLDLVIGADADSEIVFYDDDGHTQNYKHGEYAATRISVKAGDRKIIAFRKEGSYAGTVERINLKLISKEKGAYWVSVAGKPLTRYIVSDGFEAADEGWFYNMSERSIQVKCRKPEKDEFDIVVSTEKFDLIGMADE